MFVRHNCLKEQVVKKEQNIAPRFLLAIFIMWHLKTKGVRYQLLAETNTQKFMQQVTVLGYTVT